MPITDDKNYDKLMATVGILDTHYGRVSSVARRALLDAQFRKDKEEQKKYRKLLGKMSQDHEEALDIIADKLTTSEQLQATRKALRGAANKAHKFVKKLQSIKMSVDNLTEAAEFLSSLVTDIRKIF